MPAPPFVRWLRRLFPFRIPWTDDPLLRRRGFDSLEDRCAAGSLFDLLGGAFGGQANTTNPARPELSGQLTSFLAATSDSITSADTGFGNGRSIDSTTRTGPRSDGDNVAQSRGSPEDIGPVLASPVPLLTGQAGAGSSARNSVVDAPTASPTQSNRATPDQAVGLPPSKEVPLLPVTDDRQFRPTSAPATVAQTADLSPTNQADSSSKAINPTDTNRVAAQEITIPAEPNPSRQSRIGFNHENLDGWTVTVAGGTEAGKGSVRPGSAWLREGDSFLVGLERSFVVPDHPAPLVFTYTELHFDLTDTNAINDAFEASLVGPDGATLVPAFTVGRDGFFNVTEELGLATGAGTTETGTTVRTVTTDLAGVLPGTTATLRFRLVNNDHDTLTEVHILDVYVPSSNAPPVLASVPSQSATEGAALTVPATFTDPDAGDTHTAVVAWGDGTTSTAAITPTGSGTYDVSTTHTYADNGSYSATLTVTDAAGESASSPFTVVVTNVAPTVTAGVSFRQATGSGSPRVELVLAGEFTDPGFDRPSAGTRETFTAQVDWGDGLTGLVPLTVTPGGEAQPTRGWFAVSHIYAQAGVYTAHVTVRDDDMGVGSADGRAGIGRLSVTRTLDFVAGGSVPVLVMRDPGFDATQIVASSVRFAPAGVRPANNVMQVRAADVRFNFPVAQTGAHQGDTAAFLTGQLANGTPFASIAAVTVIGGAALPAVSQAGPTKFFVADAAADRSYRYAAGGAAGGNFPHDVIARDSRGAASTAAGDKVWVIDAVTHAVTVQRPDGSLLGFWRADGLQSPTGLTTDGTDVWVVDAASRKVLRYAGTASQLSGAAVAASSFNLNAGNTSPSDLVTDGQTVWVTDDARDAVFVYNLTGTLIGQWGLDPANGDASGITLDPTGASRDLWAVDRADARVYRYAEGRAWRDGNRTAADSFALAAGNVQPEGIADPIPAEAPWIKETGTRVDVGPDGSPNDSVASSPDIVRLPNGTLRMYYDGGDGTSGQVGNFTFRSAVSTDGGRTWTKEPGSRLEPGPDDPYITQPNVVVLPDGTYRMYYPALSGVWRILSAVSSDGLTWTKEAGIRIAPGGALDGVHVGTPETIRLPDGTLRMYYCGSNNYGVIHGSILSAVSADGLSWTKEPGVRLSPDRPDGTEDRGLWFPNVVQLSDSAFKMYYNGGDSANKHRIFSAVSSDGLNWTKEPGVTIDLDSSQQRHVFAPDVVEYGGTGLSKDVLQLPRTRWPIPDR